SPNKHSLVLAVQGNNEALHEETARTLTAGLDLAPAFLPGASLSLTGYRIVYDDRIVVPGGIAPFEILMQGDVWGGLAVDRNPDEAEVRAVCASPVFLGVPSACERTPPSIIVDLRLRNLASTRVTGLDLKFDQRLDAGLGELTLSLDGSYVF